MMQFFTSKPAQTQKKIDNDISELIKNQLKKQFCQLCQKNPASKVAFGKQFKPVFTCPGCQLKAVGIAQRLGPKYLILFDKFVEILTNQLISYQASTKNPPVEYKKGAQACQVIKDKSADTTSKIIQQYKKMKKVVKEKQDQLIEQSIKQNNVLIFEQINKLFKDKKLNQIQNGYVILKRALCNSKGLHFSEEQEIQLANHTINEKFVAVKKQSKIKLKPLEDLVDEINSIVLQ